MDGVDKEQVQKRVYELSKNSPYFREEQRKQQASLAAVRKKLAKVPKPPFSKSEKEHMKAVVNKWKAVDAALESSRNLSRQWIVCDMDQFFAAVAIRDDPSLKGKPVAVGDMSMISTASYEARKYGVRSAMPGFIAVDLCPQLIFVRHDFKAYKQAASQCREVFAEYDPNFSTMSLDEASLDVTDYVTEHYGSDLDAETAMEMAAAAVATAIRVKIWERTQLTASAGIACNRMLAKICADENKPNGQFVLRPDASFIQAFLNKLSVRRIPGIGVRTENMLAEMGIERCGQIREHLYELSQVCSERQMKWFLSVTHGISEATRDAKKQTVRKSISVERTFHPLKRPSELEAKLKELCEKLAGDWQARGVESGRTVTIKLKNVDFKQWERSHTPKTISVSSADKLFTIARRLLRKEYPLSLRLMGVRLSALTFKKDEDKKK